MSVRKDEQGRYILKAGDVEKTYSEEELFQMAQKGFGAEAKFESANAVLREAETKAQGAVAQWQKEFAETMRQAKAGDLLAYSKVLDHMGYNEEEKRTEMAAFQAAVMAAETPDDEEPVEQKPPKQAPVEIPEEFKSAGNVFKMLRERGLSEEEIADTLMVARDQKRKNNQEAAYANLEADLDKDPVLGKILKSGGRQAEWLKSEAREKLKGRILEHRKYDPSSQHADVAKSLRRAVEEFGPLQTTPPPGLGGAPGISHLVSHPEQPPEPTSISSGVYEDNVTQRLAHLMASE